jgi:predicted metal-dependent HD superfamily phosphohydrolase
MNKDVLVRVCDEIFPNDPTLNLDVKTIISKIDSEQHRHFHTLEHVYNVFCDLEPTSKNLQLDFLFAVCHDCVYDPKRSDNEFQSVVYISQFPSISNHPKFNILRKQILETAQLLPTRTNEADRKIIINISESNFKKYFTSIRKEYAHVKWETFKYRHLEIVKNIWRCHKSLHIDSYCKMVNNWKRRQMKIERHYVWSGWGGSRNPSTTVRFKEHGIFNVSSPRYYRRMEKWK